MPDRLNLVIWDLDDELHTSSMVLAKHRKLETASSLVSYEF